MFRRTIAGGGGRVTKMPRTLKKKMKYDKTTISKEKMWGVMKRTCVGGNDCCR